MNFQSWFQSLHPQIPLSGADAVLRLTADGGTVPFIARYRKEQTGNLDEVAIQAVIDSKERWEQVIKRQAYIVEQIESQKKLTPELKEKILGTFQLDQLEDLYLPYKQKRKTKATVAKEAGLTPLADWIWNCGHGTEAPLSGQTLELWAFTFRNEEKGVADAAAAIAGAQDILIERLSETQELRQSVRSQLFEKGFLKTGKGVKPKANSKFENYFTYQEGVPSLLKPQNSHRYLAMRRGWMEEELTLNLGGSNEDLEFEARLIHAFEAAACSVPDSPGAPVLLKAAKLAFSAHVFPSIENELHRALKEVADETAAKVFAENVRKLLLSSPFGPKGVLGVDPGIRTGCKLAVIDQSGKYVGSTVLQLQSDEGKTVAKGLLAELTKQIDVKAIAVGNGTGGRETETFLRASIKELNLAIPVVMVSEAGASVYSASEAAREEFPELDLTIRGAISIARRLQDPLAELVKIDPKSIGVGQYQHDIAPALLKKSLELVVDSCVNSVGVNLNTASYHLLAHVAGIGPSLAKAIVQHRTEQGLFKSRAELLQVPRFSSKAFEQAAGFLRIAASENPLDNTGVHPERYPSLEGLAERLQKKVSDLVGSGVELVRQDKQLAQELGTFTFEDIVRELEKPGRDPRDQFVPFQYREDIFEVKDLKPSMVCPGIVTNVTNFGAFVDIGVHQDGLVHISQLSDRFVKDPREVVSPGDRVKVRVLEVNLEKNQISLSMKQDPAERRQQQSQQPRQSAQQSRAPQGAQSARPRQNREQRPSRPPPKRFSNNPFAALAVLKESGKKSPQK